MKAIKLMSDYGCWPLWWDAGSMEVGNIPPETLGLSLGLCADLQDWAARFDATLDQDDPARSGFASSSDVAEFNRSGEALVVRVAQELGADASIRYVSTT